MNRRRPVEPLPAPRNTRALARRLFPQWPRHKQAEWALAKLRVLSGTWRFPIGIKAQADLTPDFLRALPPGDHLDVTPDRRDRVVAIKRFAKGMLK